MRPEVLEYSRTVAELAREYLAYTEKAAKPKPTRKPPKLHGAGNCGTGKGGFKPGNTCGKSGRARLAADLRAARAGAKGKDDHASLRNKAKALRLHRRGHGHAIDNESAKHLRGSIATTGKGAAKRTKPETVALARAEVRAAHSAQRHANAKEAARKPVHESPRPESLSAKSHRESLEFYTNLKSKDEKLIRDHGKEYEKEKAKLHKLEDSAFDHKVSAKIRESRAKKHQESKREFEEKYKDVIRAKSDIESHDWWIERSRKNLERAKAEDAAKGPDVFHYAKHQAESPDLIAPGNIKDRIAKYKVGDAKVRAIESIGTHYDKTESTLASKRSKAQRIVDKGINKQITLTENAGENLTPSFHAKVDRIQHHIDRASAIKDRVKAKQKETINQKRHDVESILKVDRPMGFHADDIRPGVSTSAGPLNPPSHDTRTAINEAHAFLGKTVARGDGDSVRVQIGEGPGYRAHYHSGEGPGHASDASHIQARAGEQPTIIVHEYGHALDHQTTTGGHSLNERSQEFLNHRVGNEVAVDMHEKFGAGDPGEMGRSDRFKDAMGDDYSAHYTGKNYNGHASEILSMGMEKLHLDPSRFVSRDREYAKYVMGAMDGSLR